MMLIRALMQSTCRNSGPLWQPSWQHHHRPFSSLLAPRSPRDVGRSRFRVTQTPFLPACGPSAPVRLLPRHAALPQTAGNLRCRIVPSATSRSVIQEFEVRATHPCWSRVLLAQGTSQHPPRTTSSAPRQWQATMSAVRVQRPVYSVSSRPARCYLKDNIEKFIDEFLWMPIAPLCICAQEANAISLDYDPARNEDYWRRRPVAVVQRGAQIAGAFGVWYLRGKLAGRERGMAAPLLPSLQAERLRHILTRLGPAFVKIGQVSSDVTLHAYGVRICDTVRQRRRCCMLTEV